MRPSLFFGWLSAFLPFILADCLPPEMTVNPGAAQLVPPQKRSTTPFLNPFPPSYDSRRYPWPLVKWGDQRLRVVKYCFANEEVRRNYFCLIEDGFKIWAKALGYPASKETGHSMAWLEAHDNSESPQLQYCYLPGNEHGRPWNPKVPGNALVLDEDPRLGLSDSAYASLGWIFPRHSGDVGCHLMKFGPRTSRSSIAHELGHVFGLEHEAIRNDRDKYLSYQCKNVRGYQTSFQQAKAVFVDKSDDWIEKCLCEDIPFARKFGFQGFAFAKRSADPVSPDYSPELDMDSIMLYGSGAFATSPQSCRVNLDDCVLLAYDPPGQTQFKKIIWGKRVPSRLDVQWLKEWYKYGEEHLPGHGEAWASMGG